MMSADRLVSGDDFKTSDEDDEWFGKGIYFWEHAFKQAWRCAKSHKKHPEAAVIGTVFDWVTASICSIHGNAVILREFYEKMVDDMAANNITPPLNVTASLIVLYLITCIVIVNRPRNRSILPERYMSRPPRSRESARGVG